MNILGLGSQSAMICWRSLTTMWNITSIACNLFIIAFGLWLYVILVKISGITTNRHGFWLPLIMICLGLVSAIIIYSSFMCLNAPFALFAFAFVTLLLFFAQLIIIMFVYQLRYLLQDNLNAAFVAHMKNYAIEDNKENSMDYIQNEFECCGNHEPFDWYKIQISQIPSSCCRKKFCDTSDLDEIYDEGCYNVIYEYIDFYLGIIGFFIVTSSVLPLIGVVCTFCLAYETFHANYQQCPSK